MKILHILSLLFLLILCACSEAPKNVEFIPKSIDDIEAQEAQGQVRKKEVTMSTNKDVPPNSLSKEINRVKYDFDRPDKISVLTGKLSEISGLAYNYEHNSLVSQDDESGHFYELNIQTAQVVQENKFGKKGDYEAISYFDNKIAIARHDGSLFIYDPITKKTIKHRTPLSAKNDVEGMVYHKGGHQLLLACKGQNLVEKHSKKTKSIYAFDIGSLTLDTLPFIDVSIDQLAEWVEIEYSDEPKYRIKKLTHRVKEFAPSGIAIHPKSKEYYLISARGSTIVIMDKSKQLKKIIFLNTNTIPQPEGITFDKENTLYLSTEGQGYSGKIFKFKNR